AGERRGPAQRVPGIGALGGAGEHEPLRQLAGEVLRRVDREVGLAGEQRLLDLLDEARLVAGRGGRGRAARPLVAGGTDDDELDGLAPGALEHPRDEPGLREREGAAARR